MCVERCGMDSRSRNALAFYARVATTTTQGDHVRRQVKACGKDSSRLPTAGAVPKFDCRRPEMAERVTSAKRRESQSDRLAH